MAAGRLLTRYGAPWQTGYAARSFLTLWSACQKHTHDVRDRLFYSLAMAVVGLLNLMGRFPALNDRLGEALMNPK